MKLPTSTKYLLFDMDGTLVDTEQVGPQTFLEQLKKYGKDPTKDEYELFTRIWRRDGTDINQDDWLQEIAKKHGIHVNVDAYLKEFYEMYVQGITRAPALPGANEFLRSARLSNKFGIALVTASKKQQVAAIMQHHGWNDIFDQVITSEDITRFKPDPESFIIGMSKLGAHPNESVVFEDSKNGATAGSAASCFVVGLRAGNTKPQDLSSANVVVNTLNDVSIG
jgi:HAD superfamily hydrolase (TIGR01509 family)